jgi:hypothetical protein
MAVSPLLARTAKHEQGSATDLAVELLVAENFKSMRLSMTRASPAPPKAVAASHH